MAQHDIKGTVRIGGIMAAFVRLKSTDFRAVFTALRKPARKDQREHRDAQRGPRGPWPALAPSTVALYARQGKRRNRRLLARLPNSLKATVESRSLTLASRVRWSLAHQDGPTRVGRGAIVPQRQFLYISKKLIKEARVLFKAELLRRWNKP